MNTDFLIFSNISNNQKLTTSHTIIFKNKVKKNIMFYYLIYLYGNIFNTIYKKILIIIHMYTYNT